MRKYTILASFILSSQCLGFSFVPDKIVTPMLDIFNSRNHEVPEGVEVMVTTFSGSGNIRHQGSKMILDKSKYDTFSELASSVYRMQNNDWRGTAFHIGHNLVLTNFHVLDHDRQDASCGNFGLLERSEEDRFECKKVHFCHKELDVCLVEMETIKKKKGPLFGRKERYEVAMADGPALHLKGKYLPTEDEKENAVLTAIGNTQGLGIHVSQGKGVRRFGGGLFFFAPISGGNSGGALINEEGLVVGVVRAETKTKVGNDTSKVYNLATTSDIVIQLIRKALENDPETLEKFNQSVIE